MQTIPKNDPIVIEESKENEAKERILVRSEELFMRYGFRSVTMDDLAKHLGISKKTIYQQFKDKDDIVCQVVEGHFQTERKCMSTARQEAENPVHELVIDLGHLRRSISEVNPSAAFELKKYYPKAWAIFNDHKKNWIIQCVVENLKAGIESGFYRSDINPAILARMRVEQVALAFDPAIFLPGEFSFQEIQMQFIEHFIHGILTEKGREFFNRYLQTTNEK